MRRLLGALVMAIAGSGAASAQSSLAPLQHSTPPLITQPSYISSYVSLNRSAGGQSREEFPAPAIPVVLSAGEQAAVNSAGYDRTVPPCAGEPFFVYRPPMRVPYWALREMIGPGAGLWPAGRAAGVQSAYGPPGAYWGTGYWASSYSVHSYSYYRSSSYWPAYTSRTSWYSGWYPSNGGYYSGAWYPSGGWYRSSSWMGYDAWSHYRVGSYWPGYSSGGLTIYSASTFWSGYGRFANGAPWLWYHGYPRASMQPYPVMGQWQAPNEACYTRDPSGRVVVMK